MADSFLRRAFFLGVLPAVAVIPARARPSHSYAVVVYGGTASGVMAAVGAARDGVRVALLEPGHHLGGAVSGGLGNADYGRKEVVGGYALEFYERAGRKYGVPVQWQIEPHVAEQIFREMVAEAGVTVFYRHRLREHSGVKKQGARITAIKLENGAEFSAKIFVDATYEGDLMAQAQVSYTSGRESTKQYGESLAGVRERAGFDKFEAGIEGHDKNGQLWPEVSDEPRAVVGAADNKVPAYTFRLCLTKQANNRVPFSKPKRYDARRYSLLVRALEEIDKRLHAQGGNADAKQPLSLILGPNPLPNRKTDANGRGGFSTDYVGGNYDYPDGNYRRRERIWQAHVDYQQGLLYFLQNDPQVPRAFHDEIATWGLCKDEFVDNDHWPHQLYVREARRMIGDFVMTQRDVERDGQDGSVPDVVGMGSFAIDSHNVQRIINEAGYVENEGSIMVPVKPYQIPYRVLLPKRAEATNLLVTVCVSASHVAYSTLRMEPVYMILGQAAGVAATMTLDHDVAVQDVDAVALRAKLRGQRTVTKWSSVVR